VTDTPTLPNANQECLKYQLEVLKEEIRTINDIVARMDTITQATKNWGIVTWTASIGFILSKPDLRAFVGGTAILPLIFWVIDATWRHLQRRSTYRGAQISAFLNDGRLTRSFANQKLCDFTVFDPTGVTHKSEASYHRHASLRKTLFYREVYAIYFSLATVSLLLSVIVAIAN
jgi:hypothetical protein